jgi:hypothetical protein
LRAAFFSVLGLVFLFYPSPFLPGQPPPQVLVESAPGPFRSGGLWTLTFLVDHPRPAEVEVLPPPFPDALVPGLVRREPRLRGTERWTAVEYQFLLQGSGRLILAPFEIRSPQGMVLTPPLDLDIKAPEGEGEVRVRLAWMQSPPLLRPGKPAELSLGIPDRGAGPFPAFSVIPLPEAPEGFILEALKPEPGDREAGLILRLRLIALSAAPFRLPPRTVRSGNLLLEIPSLLIPVSGAGPSPERPDPPPPESPRPPRSVPASFPELAAQVPGLPPLPFLRSAVQKILAPIRVFWDGGDRVRALAELRGRERYHPAGPLLRPLRRALETSLGLAGTPDEPWRPRLPLGISLLGILGAVVFIVLRRFLRAGKGEGGSAGYRAGLALLLILGGFCIWGLFDGRDLPGGRRSGVLRETAARRVPDAAGTRVSVFREGQPARARFSGAAWVWVELPDSPLEGGWIRREDIIFYTRK